MYFRISFTVRFDLESQEKIKKVLVKSQDKFISLTCGNPVIGTFKFNCNVNMQIYKSARLISFFVYSIYYLQYFF